MADLREALRSVAELAPIRGDALPRLELRRRRRRRVRRVRMIGMSLLAATGGLVLVVLGFGGIHGQDHPGGPASNTTPSASPTAPIAPPRIQAELIGPPRPIESGSWSEGTWTLSLGTTEHGTGVLLTFGPDGGGALTVPTFLVAGQCSLMPLGSMIRGEPHEVGPGLTWGVAVPRVAAVTVTAEGGERYEAQMLNLPDDEVPYDAYVAAIRSPVEDPLSIEALDASGSVVVSGTRRELDAACAGKSGGS
jgi:hypothetical protein